MSRVQQGCAAEARSGRARILHLASRRPLNCAALIGRLLSSMLKLKMYPAKKGDAFLINANGNHLLIDGGYASTYTDYIAQDLAELSR
jgi:hypothetical protein